MNPNPASTSIRFAVHDGEVVEGHLRAVRDAEALNITAAVHLVFVAVDYQPRDAVDIDAAMIAAATVISMSEILSEITVLFFSAVRNWSSVVTTSAPVVMRRKTVSPSFAVEAELFAASEPKERVGARSSSWRGKP
eukprot:CAMPEP_0171919126 /NCGR_PEP_ID=MMETSP0993-20121228/17786_1 /TAXON_ID=483369 /ORGANISM="non described non described, Strain CCMP2098" /LENGTH=135 /DNA_ID=CAMNT_0012555675 /DNA_START=486 /DNA_END=891 /DNA_ORIENTATION=-